MDNYQYEQLQDALYILNDMESTFEQWYPQRFDSLPEEEKEYLSKSDISEAKEQFCRTKLNLELGEYTVDDYDYLQWLIGRVLDNE